MSAVEIILYVASYVMAALFVGFCAHEDLETHEIVWWPITFLKFLVRTFWLAISEGWRP